MFYYFFICLLFCCSSAPAQNIEEKHTFQRAEYFARLSNTVYPGDSSLNVTYYSLWFKLSTSPVYLQGVAEIHFITERTSSRITLDLASALTVDSVYSGSTPVAFTAASDKLTISLPRTLLIGEAGSVRIVYRGIPIATGFGSIAFSTTPSGLPAIFTLSEPYGAKDWFPCKDTPADKADSADIFVRTDTSLISVSNGVLISTTRHSDGTHTAHWKTGYPIAHYLLSLAIAPYKKFSQVYEYEPGKFFPIDHYMYPESFDTWKPEYEKTIDIMNAFSHYYGVYPFAKEKYGHAQFGWGGGMEHQTVSSMGGAYQALIAHELAHQWFGDKVTCSTWKDIWLNEGFASFSESLYREWNEGKQAYNTSIAVRMETAKLATGSVSVQNINSLAEIFSGYRSYHKGQIIVHMLRGMLGDSLFFRALKAYLNDPALAYQSAKTEDLRRVLEHYYGSSLEAFFQQWIYGTGYPKYEITWQQDGTLLSIRIAQLQNEQIFIMPVQLHIQTRSGDTLITLINDSRNQKYQVRLSSPATSVVFDPNNFILKDVINLGEIRPSDSKGFDLAVFPNPTTTFPVISLSVSIPQIIETELISLEGVILTGTPAQSYQPGVYTISYAIPALSSGIYFIRTSGSKGTSVIKFIKL